MRLSRAPLSGGSWAISTRTHQQDLVYVIGPTQLPSPGACRRGSATLGFRLVADETPWYKPGPRSYLLVKKVRLIQRVALFGDEAGAADHAPQVFFTGLMRSAGLADDVFLEHDAADVVAAETQP